MSVKTIQRDKEQFFQQMGLEQLESTSKQEIGLLSHTTYKINSKCIIDLHVRVKTIKLLQEKSAVNLYDLS